MKLSGLIDRFSGEKFKLKQKIEEVRVPRDERVVIYETPDVLVVRPMTHRASCKYGHGTPWCVSVPSNERWFDTYTKKGLLYMVILYKHDKESGQKYEYYKLAMYKKATTKNETWYDIKDKRVMNIDMFKKFHSL